MIKLIIKIILIVIVSILQLSFLPNLAIIGAWPNMVLLFAVILALVNRRDDAFLFAGVGGMILDLSSPYFFGLNTGFILLSVVLTLYLSKKFLSETNLITIFITGLLFSLLYGIFSMFLSHNWFLVELAIETIYGAVFSCLVYVVINYYVKPTQMVRFGK